MQKILKLAKEELNLIIVHGKIIKNLINNIKFLILKKKRLPPPSGRISFSLNPLKMLDQVIFLKKK